MSYRLPRKSRLQITNDQADPNKKRFRWKRNNGALTTVADSADPVNGSPAYRVCLYDASANPQPLQNATVPPGGTCGTKPCWRTIGNPLSPKGYKYRNKDAAPDGIRDMKLLAGTADRAKLQVKGRGANLAVPSLSLTLPVTVQLRISDGVTTECWQTTFTESQADTPEKFKAKGP
jgi:hypothetical protein